MSSFRVYRRLEPNKEIQPPPITNRRRWIVLNRSPEELEVLASPSPEQGLIVTSLQEIHDILLNPDRTLTGEPSSLDELLTGKIWLDRHIRRLDLSDQ